jgi:hypothetical protein
MWPLSKWQASRYKLGREPQSDEDFISQCGFEPGTSQAAVALTVRRVIGECGSIEAAYIHNDDLWPRDLCKLDFWDSIDFLHFVFSVENATQMHLQPDDELQGLFRSGFVVSELIRKVVRSLTEE